MASNKELYTILGVDETASDAEIRSAYEHLISENPEGTARHADVSADNSQSIVTPCLFTVYCWMRCWWRHCLHHIEIIATLHFKAGFKCHFH